MEIVFDAFMLPRNLLHRPREQKALHKKCWCPDRSVLPEVSAVHCSRQVRRVMRGQQWPGVAHDVLDDMGRRGRESRHWCRWENCRPPDKPSTVQHWHRELKQLSKRRPIVRAPTQFSVSTEAIGEKVIGQSESENLKSTEARACQLKVSGTMSPPMAFYWENQAGGVRAVGQWCSLITTGGTAHNQGS